MRFDPDLAREILLAIEATPPNRDARNISIAGHDEDTIFEHLEALGEAGLIEVNFAYTASEDQRIAAAWPKRLTWAGHEFLNNARNDEVWSKTKAVVTQVSGQKSKTCNWLHVDSFDIRNFANENACAISLFSERLTLRICSIV